MSDESGYTDETQVDRELPPQCHLRCAPNCFGELTGDDGPAWEQVFLPKTAGEGPELRQDSIWICNNCIAELSYVKELYKQIAMYDSVGSALLTINSFIKNAKE